jgi:hypothetical protein
LIIGKFLAALPVLLDSLQAQALFQHTDLELRELQFISQLFNAL